MYYLWIDPWVRKLGYALIDDDLKIIDAGILLQDKKSPTREDQFNRANQILEFLPSIFTLDVELLPLILKLNQIQ